MLLVHVVVRTDVPVSTKRCNCANWQSSCSRRSDILLLDASSTLILPAMAVTLLGKVLRPLSLSDTIPVFCQAPSRFCAVLLPKQFPIYANVSADRDLTRAAAGGSGNLVQVREIRQAQAYGVNDS